MDDKTINSSACGSFNDFNWPMPKPNPMSASAMTNNFLWMIATYSKEDAAEYIATAFRAHDRAILEAAADRHCRKTCDERGYRDSEYHCRICPDRRAILEPRTKEKS